MKYLTMLLAEDIKFITNVMKAASSIRIVCFCLVISLIYVVY